VKCNSIEKRVLAAVIASELLLTLGLVAIAISYTRHRVFRAFDAGLNGRAMSIAALVHYADEANSGFAFDQNLVPPLQESPSPELYLVYVSTVGVLARSENWPRALDLVHRPSPSVFIAGGVRYRGIWLRNVPIMDEDRPASPPEVSVFYALSTQTIDQELLTATTIIAGCSMMILAVSVLLTLWGIRGGLQPLRTLAQQASSVSTKNWEVRFPAGGQPEELKPLSHALSAMLGRLHRSFVQQREFLSNAAHELKTPVAILKSTLQSLLYKPRATDEYRLGIEQALDDLERLEKLLMWMLRLARAEHWAAGAARSDLHPVEIIATCEEAVTRIATLAKQRHVSIRFHTNGASSIRADPEDLQVIWVNLLENAVRFSPEYGIVEMRAEGEEDRARVSVSDHGPGIPQDQIDYIFARFHRGDPSRARDTGGFGLGLPLVKALTEAYGGTIHLSSDSRHGTRVTVELPLSRNNSGKI
jgi:signal transduction histidine kinase